MKKPILFGAVLLWTTLLLTASTFQPLSVKTGLWQVTAISTASGLPPITPEMQAQLDRMPPEQRARLEEAMKSRFGGTPHTTHYQKCVTAKDLDTNAFNNEKDDKCTWTVLTSTGSEMEVRGTSCAAGREQGMETDLSIKLHVLDSENVKAAMRGTATGNGHTVNISGSYTGKWIGASCPAGTD